MTTDRLLNLSVPEFFICSVRTLIDSQNSAWHVVRAMEGSVSLSLGQFSLGSRPILSMHQVSVLSASHHEVHSEYQACKQDQLM